MELNASRYIILKWALTQSKHVQSWLEFKICSTIPYFVTITITLHHTIQYLHIKRVISKKKKKKKHCKILQMNTKKFLHKTFVDLLIPGIVYTSILIFALILTG